MEAEFTGVDITHRRWITAEPINLLNPTGITLNDIRVHKWIDGSKTSTIIEIDFTTDGFFTERETIDFTAGLGIKHPVVMFAMVEKERTETGEIVYAMVNISLGNEKIELRAFPFQPLNRYRIKTQAFYRTLGT